MNWVQRQFLALRSPAMPERVEVGGRAFTHVETFKHDFFAATGLYRRDDERIVVKLYRQRPFFGLPAAWTGRIQVRHEMRLYRMLDDLPGVPTFLGPVGRTGFAHAFVPGQPLRRDLPVDDRFFRRLADMLDEIHRRGVAYVDLNKANNILLGDNGAPWLIDFQISYAPRRRWFGSTYVLRRLQSEDRYHLLKHKRRIRPDLLTDAERAHSQRTSPWIRIHRVLTRPYFRIRRPLMRWLGLKSVE